MSFVPVKHTNPAFNEMLGEIGAQVTEMAELCEKALADACQAASESDRPLAKSISRRDGRINDLEKEITLNVATAIARHNPVAHDLHALMGSVKMAQELERLADHSKNIGRRIAQLIKHDQDVAFKDDIVKLGRRTHKMLRDFLDAEAANDIDGAISVWQLDSQVNDIYTDVMTKAFTCDEDPRVLINSVFIAKNFERIGDKIKNLAEVASFQKTGEILDLEEADDDDDN